MKFNPYYDVEIVVFWFRVGLFQYKNQNELKPRLVR